MKTSGISRKFLKHVLIVLMIGQMISLTSIYRERKKVEEGELDKRAKLLAAMVAKSAARSLLDNYDFTYLSILTDEILNDADIVVVELKDREGKEFVFSRNNRKPSSSASIVVPITTRLDEAGNIRISYTYDNIRKGLLRHILLLLLVQAAVFLTLVLLIRYFFRKDLGKKIKLVGDVIEEVKSGDLATRINYGKADEIGVIANGFDFLVEHLAATIQKMRAISLNLAEAAEHVQRTFRRMADTAGEQQTTTETILQAVNEATRSQQQIAENTGNLLAGSQTNSKALEGIKTTFDGVVNSVDALDGSVATIYSSIAELSGSSKDVASLAERAARSVREAFLSIKSIGSSAAEIDAVVNESTALSARVTEILSVKGISSINDTIESMGRIESFFNSLSGTIAQLDARSKDIATILTVIQEVTEQARLLSLNAQIIAAHAGKNGKSFAVVADEMKILSTRTAGSAKEIEGIVENIQREIRSAVSATSETSRNVREGKVVVAVTDEVIRELLVASRRSSDMMKRIAVSTGEQNRLLETVVKDINILRDLNERVKTATGEEEKSAAHLFTGIGLICDSMGETRGAVQHQADALKTIAENMDAANRQTREIADASFEQKQVNRAIIESIDAVSRMGGDMVEAVREVSASIGGVHRELDRLRTEMKFFRTERDASVP